MPSPEIFYYRNKMEFAFGRSDEGNLVLGLRKRGRFDGIVNLSECLLLSEETGRLLESVRRWANGNGLAPYDLKSRRGFLRYLVVREGKNTGKRMVYLVTKAGQLPADSFISCLESSGVRVDTAVWGINDAVSDVARGEKEEILKGDGSIDEKLGRLVFKISPATFFQTNTRGTEVLYGIIKSLLGPSVHVLIDFYCGSGSIGLFCAGEEADLLGVESNPAAIRDAQANALRFSASRSEFICSDAGSFAGRPELLKKWKAPGAAAVMDPPRPGLQPAVRKLLLEHPIDRWVYVSCNPKALAVDLPYMMGRYQIDVVQPVDLFPHTEHVETVLMLTRR